MAPSKITFSSQAELEEYVQGVIDKRSDGRHARGRKPKAAISAQDHHLPQREHVHMLRVSRAERKEVLSRGVQQGVKRARALAKSLRSRRGDQNGFGVVPLSPGEEQRLKSEELAQRRKVRLLQVREQEKLRAAETRRAYKLRRSKLEEAAADHAQQEWEHHHKEEVQKMHDDYRCALTSIGKAHRNALAATEERAGQAREKAELRQQRHAAERARHESALAKARHERRSHPVVVRKRHSERRNDVRQTMSQTQRIQAQQFAKQREAYEAAEAEALRAQQARIERGDIVYETLITPSPAGYTIDDFSNTRYHARVICHKPVQAGEQNNTAEPSAFENAAALRERQAEAAAEKARLRAEADLRAAERGKAAMERLRMEKEREALTDSLEQLARDERRKKSEAAAVAARDVARSHLARADERAKRTEPVMSCHRRHRRPRPSFGSAIDSIAACFRVQA